MKADFRAALEGKDLPILTLDNKWHKLFTQREKTPEIDELADDINALMEKQAKLRDDEKKVKALKKKLMSEIIELRDRVAREGEKSKASKELDEHTRLINDCNDRIEQYQDELIDIPREIYQKNMKLMMLSMDICYEKLERNSDHIEEIDKWITATRIELKKQIIEKQRREVENFNLYSYMHDIFGAEVIEIFDIGYDPEKQHPIRTMNIDSRAGGAEGGIVGGNPAG